MAKHPLVYRLASIWPADLSRIEMHRLRRGGDLAHVDHNLSHMNELLIGEETWKDDLLIEIEQAKANNLVAAYGAKIAKKRKKDAAAVKAAGLQNPWKENRSEGPLREGVITANREYFSGADGQPDPARRSAFEATAVTALRAEFGSACIAAWIDRDEEADHIHFVVAPWKVEESKNLGRQKLLVPSSITVIADYEFGQTAMAAHFAKIDLTRGRETAKARREARETAEKLPPRREHVAPHVWRAEVLRTMNDARDDAAKATEEAEARRAAADLSAAREDEARAAAERHRKAARSAERRAREEQVAAARAARLAREKAEEAERRKAEELRTFREVQARKKAAEERDIELTRRDAELTRMRAAVEERERAVAAREDRMTRALEALRGLARPLLDAVRAARLDRVPGVREGVAAAEKLLGLKPSVPGGNRYEGWQDQRIRD